MANWSGTWPGLVGMLNLNGSLTKAGVQVLDAVERGFHRRAFVDELRAVARARATSSTRPTTSRRSTDVKIAAARARRSARRWPQQLQREKAIMGVFDEGCMGMFNAIIPDHLLQPDRRLQGAAQPVGAVLRDDAGQRRRGPRRARSGWKTAGMKFVTGPNHDERPDRRADSAAVQDVHRRGADRRRLRLRRDRHPVPAGAQGPAAGQRPGRRHAQQRRPPAGDAAATAGACSTTASRCRTSTKSTSAPASTG